MQIFKIFSLEIDRFLVAIRLDWLDCLENSGALHHFCWLLMKIEVEQANFWTLSEHYKKIIFESFYYPDSYFWL